MCKQNVKTSHFLILLLIICVIFSCGNPHDESPLLPEKIELTAELGSNDGTATFFICGPREIDFSVNPERGVVESVQFFYQNVEVNSFNNQSSGRFLFTPDMSKEGVTNLEMKITVAVEQKKYYETVNFEMQYVKVSEDDFELIDVTIDRFVFKKNGKRLDNYKIMFTGKDANNPAIIDDLDNIVFKREPFSYNTFPIETSIKILFVPKEQMYDKYLSYTSVFLDMKDKKLGDFPSGNSLFHYVDFIHEQLYVWSLGELYIFNKNMSEIKHKPMEYINSLFVTPETGLVIVKPFYGDIVTYSDNNFNTIISSIEPRGYIGILHVNERDQLFNGHNFNIDAYDLYTGKRIFSLDFNDHVRGFIISGDKLVVNLGNDGESQVYQLNKDSATYLYSFQKTYMNLIAHPININHIILDNTYNGFEIFDLESRTTIRSFKGQFQSIDPISGSLLYYDENYSYSNNMYDNHVIDLSYNEVFVFKDTSQSTLGPFLQFNNYIIKGDRCVNLLPKVN